MPKWSPTFSPRQRAESHSRSGSKSKGDQKTIQWIVFRPNARVGQQGTLTRVWAKRGTRPRAVRDTRYEWAYLFGAVCPERATGAALVFLAGVFHHRVQGLQISVYISQRSIFQSFRTGYSKNYDPSEKGRVHR